MRYAARISSLRPKVQERILSGELRMPALDKVEPRPITNRSPEFVYLEAWRFLDMWRPAGAMGVGKGLLSDLEVFMDEAGMDIEERAFCRKVVGEMDAAYVAETNALAAGGSGAHSTDRQGADRWRHLRPSK